MSAPFKPVENAFKKYLPGFDLQVPEAVLAAKLAADLDTDPVWLMLVGPASHGKGTTLDPLAGVEDAFMLSSITPKTFLSGSPGTVDPSLLTKLGERPFIVAKELGTLLESDPKARGQIFAQLREVFDGQFAASYGNGLSREWTGKACLIVGFTNAIDAYASFDGLLGERFLKIRFRDIADPVALAMEAIRSSGTEKQRVAAIRSAYERALVDGRKALKKVSLSATTEQRIANLATAISTIRTPVTRNIYKRDRVEFAPKSESPARLVKSLHAFAQATAALRGERDLSDLRLVYRVAFDTMAEPRRSIFINSVRCMQTGVQPTRKDVEGLVERSQTDAHLDDLCRIGAFQQIEGEPDGTPGRPANRYVLSDTLRARLHAACALPWLSNGDVHADKPKGTLLPSEP